MVAALTLAGCGTSASAASEDQASPQQPRLSEQAFIASDGARLPVSRWQPEGEPRGIVLALHGFTEHGGVFYALGPWLAAAGYTVLAIDQRGFGDTARRGWWAGRERMIADVRGLYRILDARARERPVYLLGHSMGAAVAALAVTGDGAVQPAGSVLIAPAFRSWSTLPWPQRIGLNIAATVAPGLRPNQSTGRTLAQIQVTDDPKVRHIQARDQTILSEVRFDMLAGVMDLMTAARRRVDALPPRTLLQFAGRDDMVPPRATCGVLDRLARREPPRPRVALYPEGYHFLTRDRQRPRTIADIEAWLADPSAPLPSGDEHTPGQARARLCPAQPEADPPSPAR